MSSLFSFARSLMDYIQSATGLKVLPSSIGTTRNSEGSKVKEKSKTSKKIHSPIPRICHTSIGRALQSYKQSLTTAASLGSDTMSTILIEEDFAYALSSYCASFVLRNGEEVFIRPLLPNDIVRMKEVLTNGEVSQQSLSFRFNSVTFSIKEQILQYFTHIDYDTHFAVGAMIKENGKWKGVATARFIEDNEDSSTAEWATIVCDKYQGLGIGSCLLYYISFMASQFDCKHLCAIVHDGNYPVLHWMKKLDAYQKVIHDCRYWIFDTHVYPAWIYDDTTRIALEMAASGASELTDETMHILRFSMQGLNEALLQENQTNNKVGLKSGVEMKTKMRSIPVVLYTKSFEDEIEMDDLF